VRAGEQRASMRWKLVIITSLIAAVVGAGGALGLALGLTGSTRRPGTVDIYAILMLLVPVIAVFFASLFVYRHTARWRRAQAFSTALLSTLLTLTILLAAFTLSARLPSEQGPPAPPQRNTA
jgi:phosphate/sulfate permease